MKHALLLLLYASLTAGIGLAGCEATGDAASTGDQFEDLRWGGLDLGDDWIDELDSPLRRPGAAADRAGRTSYWSVMLGTYSDEGHAGAATRMVASLGVIEPRLAGAHVHTSPKGSMVLYGAYESVDDDEAQRDLAWIKGLQLRGRTVFPRAMLSRVTTGAAEAGTLAEFSLLAVRELNPDINPLYTLQVGVWGKFDSDLDLDEVQRRAELQVRRLRGEGHEAFFHHDPDKGLSMVTVGLFNHTAVDAETNLYDPEVEHLFEVFPAHLVNGEPFKEPIDKRRPNLGTRLQTPRLVLVPTL